MLVWATVVFPSPFTDPDMAGFMFVWGHMVKIFCWTIAKNCHNRVFAFPRNLCCLTGIPFSKEHFPLSGSPLLLATQPTVFFAPTCVP